MLLTIDHITQPITEWAADYGIPVNLISSRLRRGWSEERAVTEPMIVRRGEKLPADAVPSPMNTWKPEQRDNRLTFDGLSLTISEWSGRTGIAYHTIKVRLRKGWSVERALTEPTHTTPGPTPRLIEFNGEKLSVPQWSERLGIHEDTIRGRLWKGWPVEKALTTGRAQGKRHLGLAA